MAAVDYFLKIDGIDGESTDAKHKGEINVESFSFGLSNAGRATSGASAGKPAFQDFHFTTSMSKASPKLMLACASGGQHIKTATLTGRVASKEQLEFVVFKMTDLLVSTYEDSGSPDGVPTDQISLNFAKIEFAYRAGLPDGTLAEPLLTGWNLAPPAIG